MYYYLYFLVNFCKDFDETEVISLHFIMETTLYLMWVLNLSCLIYSAERHISGDPKVGSCPSLRLITVVCHFDILLLRRSHCSPGW